MFEFVFCVWHENTVCVLGSAFTHNMPTLVGTVFEFSNVLTCLRTYQKTRFRYFTDSGQFDSFDKNVHGCLQGGPGFFLSPKTNFCFYVFPILFCRPQMKTFRSALELILDQDLISAELPFIVQAHNPDILIMC